MKDPKIFAVANSKGGTGKTTIALLTASLWAERGLRTLVIDLDPSGFATMALKASKSLPGVAEYLLDEASKTQSVAPNLEVLGATDQLRNITAQQFIPEDLADRLEDNLAEHFDRIVIDCPGSTDMTAMLGLVAANTAILVTSAHTWGLDPIVQIAQQLERRRSKKRTGPDQWCVLANMFEPFKGLHQELVDGIIENLPLPKTPPVFNIPRHELLAQQTVLGQTYKAGGLQRSKPYVLKLLEWLDNPRSSDWCDESYYELWGKPGDTNRYNQMWNILELSANWHEAAGNHAKAKASRERLASLGPRS